MIFLILIAVIAIFVLCLYWDRRKFIAFVPKLPGPSPIYSTIDIVKRNRDVFYLLDDYYKQYGPTYAGWLGPFPMIVTSEPQLIQEILNSPDCVNKGVFYRVVQEAFGSGLMTSPDPEWSRHRKLLNPAFKQKVLQGLMPSFNKKTDALVKEFDLKRKQGGQNLFKILCRSTLELTTQTTMGLDLDSEMSAKKAQLLDSYECLPSEVVRRMTAPWLAFPIIRSILSDQRLVEQSIIEVRKIAKKLVQRNLEAAKDDNDKSSESNIFINVACEAIRNGHLTNQEVENESNNMILGAFETTANTVGYIIMCLAMFPATQQKLFEEIRSFFPEPKDFQVTIADTQQLVYMDMVINETMRLLAPVPYVVRKPTKDIKLSNGLVIPNGLDVLIDIFHLHRRKDIWGPDADTFNPENFLPSNLEDKHSYAFIPFTKGIRQCIGWRYGLLSVKVILTKLVRNFHFTTDTKFEDLSFIEGIVLKLKETPLIHIHRREN